MTDISKETVAGIIIGAVDDGHSERVGIASTLRAQAARIEELEADVEHLSQFLIDAKEALATARNDALKEAAKAMNPTLRSMISRGEASRAILSLMTKEPNT